MTTNRAVYTDNFLFQRLGDTPAEQWVGGANEGSSSGVAGISTGVVPGPVIGETPDIFQGQFIGKTEGFGALIRDAQEDGRTGQLTATGTVAPGGLIGQADTVNLFNATGETLEAGDHVHGVEVIGGGGTDPLVDTAAIAEYLVTQGWVATSEPYLLTVDLPGPSVDTWTDVQLATCDYTDALPPLQSDITDALAAQGIDCS